MLQALLSFGLTVILILLFQPIAIKIKLIDSPGGRKHHQGEIPLTGGLAMFLGFAFSLLTVNISLLPYRALLAACGLLVIVGILDDLRELTAKARLLSQIFSAFIMIFWGHNIIHHLGNIFFINDFSLGILAIPLTLFSTVGFINATNMLDGLDGLAGSQILISLLCLLSMALMHHNIQDCYLLLITIAAVSSFLIFNFPFPWRKQAVVFMGDAGSMFLGIVLCWFAIRFTQMDQPIMRPVTMLWIFLIPLFDTLRLLILRSFNKKSPFSPNRDHIHHLLSIQGFSPLKINGLLSLISFSASGFGIFGEIYQISEGWMFALFMLIFIIFVVITHQQYKNNPFISINETPTAALKSKG
jgi:UDP-GlcNAc:undecaprenyl-phosphate/decaprenyl-phosphate GlcNAc-1-phosphate transferase